MEDDTTILGKGYCLHPTLSALCEASSKSMAPGTFFLFSIKECEIEVSVCFDGEEFLADIAHPTWSGTYSLAFGSHQTSAEGSLRNAWNKLENYSDRKLCSPIFNSDPTRPEPTTVKESTVSKKAIVEYRVRFLEEVTDADLENPGLMEFEGNGTSMCGDTNAQRLKDNLQKVLDASEANEGECMCYCILRKLVREASDDDANTLRQSWVVVE